MCPAYIRATERDYWGWKENRQRCRGGSGASGGWWGGDNTSLVLNTAFNAINNESDHECLNETFVLRNAHPIQKSTADWVPGCKHSIPCLSGTKFLVHHVWAIWLIVRRWVWDSDMPGALAADKMGLGKTFTSVAAAMICRLLTEQVVLGLLLTMLWGHTLDKWVNMLQKKYTGIISK